MHRLASRIVLVTILGVALSVWLLRAPAGFTPISVKLGGTTNLTDNLRLASLQITNRTRHWYSYQVSAEVPQGQGGLGVRRRTGKYAGPVSGSLAGFSQNSSWILLPKEPGRFVISYERTPSMAECYVSWACTWMGFRFPFLPKTRTFTISAVEP